VTTTEENTDAPPVPRKAKIAAVVALAAVALYIFTSLVIVSPTSAFRSAMAPLVSAASPYFSQKWNVFAPNIMKTNIGLSVQAQWRNEAGELVKSEWVSLTGLEQQAVPGNAIPSRIQKSSWNAALIYSKRYALLTAAQKDIVRDTFIERAGDGYRAKPVEPLIEQLQADGDNTSDIVRFLRYDYMLKEYATDFATAYFGHDIERVRWQVDRSQPNDFDHRFEQTQQFDDRAVTFGWRQADDVIDPETIAVYDDVIERYGR
jgi:hypothetical protein